MKSRLRTRTRQRTRMVTRIRLIALGTSLLGVALFFLYSAYFNVGVTNEAKASTSETLPSGSFIINMGVVPQTYANGMKPYGLVYELVTVYNVPVKWVIEPSKVADGIDFTHNSISYKGGTFIIPAYYITSTVASRISYWQSQGVVGDYSISSITVPVYHTITGFPNTMIDNLFSAQDTVIHYFDNAGIPSTAYSVGRPADATECIDLWLNPHGEPSWSTHQYLHNFVTVFKSYIWSQCHAVSMLESCRKSTAPFTQLNFLSSAGLQCWKSAKCGLITEVHSVSLPSPIVHSYPTDPIMQFMGNMDGTAPGGSEKWYVPVTGTGWRSTTKLLVTAGSIPAPGQGIIMAYGPAYGDSTNGLVMYESGHDLDETAPVAGRVSAQRAMLNFYIMAGMNKTPQVSAVQISGSLNGGNWDTLEVSVNGGKPPYTYHWSSSLGGVLDFPDSSKTHFAAPPVTSPSVTIVTCVVTDACGRRSFFTQPVFVNVSPLPISLLSFTAEPNDQQKVDLEWITGTEQNNNFFTIERSNDGYKFDQYARVSSKGNSIVPRTYRWEDESPLSGISYYRLKQTDFNGTTRLCSQVKIQMKEKIASDEIAAGPNPFSEMLNIRFFAETSGSAVVSLWNGSGAVAFQQQVSVDKGRNTISLSGFDQLKTGVYILRIEREGEFSAPVKLLKK